MNPTIKPDCARGVDSAASRADLTAAVMAHRRRHGTPPSWHTNDLASWNPPGAVQLDSTWNPTMLTSDTWHPGIHLVESTWIPPGSPRRWPFGIPPLLSLNPCRASPLLLGNQTTACTAC
jgi:hypothetical protein